MLNGIIKTIAASNQFAAFRRAVDAGEMCQISGLSRGAKAAWLAAAYQNSEKSVLMITPNAESAQFFYANLQAYLGEKQVVLFPRLALLPFSMFDHDMQVVQQRISVLTDLVRGERRLVVASADTLMRRLVMPDKLRNSLLTLQTGKDYDMDKLAANLVALGYARESKVESCGTFSIRGSICDIFATGAEMPYRIEFFDTEVESIRYFDLQTQRNMPDKLQKIDIMPAHEVVADADDLLRAAEKIDVQIDEMSKKLKGQAKYDLQQRFSAQSEKMRQNIRTAELESFISMMFDKTATLVDYVGSDADIFWDEADDIADTVASLEKDRHNYYAELLDSGQILPAFDDNFVLYQDFIDAFLIDKAVALNSLGASRMWSGKQEINVFCREIPSCVGRFDLLTDLIGGWRKNKFNVYFAASSQMRAGSMRDIIAENNLGSVDVQVYPIGEGFESIDWKIALLSEKEVLGRRPKRNLPRRKRAAGNVMDNFVELEAGDYVVHINHGIGRYIGIERIETAGVARDYMKIEYAGADRLYVPVDQMNMVQKYIGNDSNPPKINHLGGLTWQKAKNRAKKSVQDMTDELLALYAAREAQQGFAFSADSSWQSEFEDSFEYPETEDQLQAIDEIKKDMQKAKPMDRLLCGDVGYGKTEVAIRAAFKAALDSKQVAMLVPTTLLAEQHYRTFCERMKDFPVKIGVLSRFVTAKQQKKVLEDLKSGALDILIGTHRLLSKDIEFKDLGLLIVDEEQRFGVAHKEKIKQMRKNVDVLTLSATPIPRTLHMSLVGMRDMSVINTPPADRVPVQTYVVEFNDRLIRDAVEMEMRRGGQVYFIHNKVDNIMQVADFVQGLVPEARIGIAHGQMKERELEQAMGDFIEGNTDVLICTSIAESGLDIPNVNTLIVNNADMFGLSQLYQFRGRVGRSSRQAYAYFTFGAGKMLSDVAKARLKAIRDFTELGAGFKIAMRDMEIRGAGNILGPEQHGHIAAVGFDMYCRLVQQVLAETKGQTTALAEEEPPTLDLGVNAYIPDQYVEDADAKIDIYRRIAGISSLDVLAELADEVRERFGPRPASVEHLFMVGTVKYLCRGMHILSITAKAYGYDIAFRENHDLNGAVLLEIAQKYGKQVLFRNKKDFTIEYHIMPSKNKNDELQQLASFIDEINRLVSENVIN